MATKKPKAPKLLKYPKKPKISASASVWIKYDERCKAIDKKNSDRQKKHKSAINGIGNDQKKKLSIIKKYSK